MKLKSRWIVAILLLCQTLPMLALEAREGLVRAVVDENSARLSLYRLVDVAKGRYEPFYFDQDPRTSFVTLSFDGRQYRIGDAADFQRSVSRTEKGIQVDFRASFCSVVESIEFVRSAGSALADGVRITYAMENVSQKDASVGLRLLLDTSLAEKSGIHFRTPSKEKIAEETVFEGEGLEPWISTPGEKADLMVMLSGPGVERPDRVHLANWKRLNDAPWILDASSARNFTLLPYSVNDSAMAVYWLPASLARGSIKSVSIILGAFNEGGYPLASSGAEGTEALFAQTVLTAPSADPNAALAADLVAVRDLISRIDLVLSSGSPPSPEELDAWKKILERLETRKKDY